MVTLAPDLAPSVQKQVWTVMCGIVHDLRQPLSVMETCTDYLELVLPENERPAHRQLQVLQQQIVEANRLLHDALKRLGCDEVRAKPGAPAPAPREYRPSREPGDAAAGR